jgi:hypothetical protein
MTPGGQTNPSRGHVVGPQTDGPYNPYGCVTQVGVTTPAPSLRLRRPGVARQPAHRRRPRRRRPSQGRPHAWRVTSSRRGRSWPGWSWDDPWVVGADADSLPAGAVRLPTSAGRIPVAGTADALDDSGAVRDDGQWRPAPCHLLAAILLASEGDELRAEVGRAGRATGAADRHGRRRLGRQAGDSLGQRPAPLAGGSSPGLAGSVSLHHPGTHYQPAAGPFRLANHQPSTLPARPARQPMTLPLGETPLRQRSVAASRRQMSLPISVGCALIIPMIIQTIGLDPSGAVWTRPQT